MFGHAARREGPSEGREHCQRHTNCVWQQHGNDGDNAYWYHAPNFKPVDKRCYAFHTDGIGLTCDPHPLSAAPDVTWDAPVSDTFSPAYQGYLEGQHTAPGCLGCTAYPSTGCCTGATATANVTLPYRAKQRSV